MQDAFSWIKQIATYKEGHVKMLSLTGGEPFYDIEKLYRISTYAKDNGLFVACVSNASWAASLEEAVNILNHLQSIEMISMSTDVYHQEFISIYRIINATNAAEKCNRSYKVNVCTTDVEDATYINTINTLNKFIRKGALSTSITIPFGRAKDQANKSSYILPEETYLSPCTTLSSPLVCPDGKVMACCGALLALESDHPLILGNLREASLSRILEGAESNAVLHAIRIWGPNKLIDLIKKGGLAKHLPQKYIKNCPCYTCYNFMANQRIVDFLFELADDSEFKRFIAYARAYYLHEYGGHCADLV